MLHGLNWKKYTLFTVVTVTELGAGWRLAGFSIVKSEPNQPTDRDILLHIVKTYLSEMHTDVTPPLVEVSPRNSDETICMII